MQAEPKTLDIAAKQNVQYCIPEFLKLEQIKINLRKPCGRIEGATELRKEPIACVSFGPSLKTTWEKIKEFKWVMSCSGAHKFLVEHGITPTWQIDVDPREHKIKLIGEPQKGTTYLMASTVHPKMIDFLHQAGCDVRLWHIFDSAEEGYRILPQGEWMICGGCSAGVRTITLARFLGFTDIHVFGQDGSFADGEGSHAGEHPNDCSRKPPYETEYNGVKYRTTPSMLEAARNTWHELDMMKDVRATFHGEGLVQSMSKDYVRKELPEKAQVFIAFDKPELISAEYRELNARLHQENPMYGIGGARHAKTVLNLCEAMKTTCVLDYGCGKSQLQRELPFAIFEYDPAIPGKEASPRPADIVTCTDVLEHIEPEKIGWVLKDIARCVRQIGFFTIHTGQASKSYANGVNTHLLQRSQNWWIKALKKVFKIGKVFWHPPILTVIVAPKNAQKETVRPGVPKSIPGEKQGKAQGVFQGPLQKELGSDSSQKQVGILSESRAEAGVQPREGALSESREGRIRQAVQEEKQRESGRERSEAMDSQQGQVEGLQEGIRDSEPSQTNRTRQGLSDLEPREAAAQEAGRSAEAASENGQCTNAAVHVQ